MESQFINTLVYGLLAAIATFVGIYMVVAKEEWALKKSVFFIGFSAGVVLAVAFIHLMPEAMESNVSAPAVVLLAILAFYILEHMLAIHSCKEGHCEVHPMGMLAFVGIAFHSLLDGIVIGVGFEAGFTVGLASSLAVLMHEIPEGIAVTALLLHAGYKKNTALMLAGVVAIATPIGALGSYQFVSGADTSTIGFLLAIAAGSFIYIGASDLLPETHKHSRRLNIFLVLGGALLVYLISMLFPG
ncbi:MAG: ZIP family metal transporter [Deltaproteobacteria bacterium]|nr:ZIP family metal transporter [Deltaproteobacteria bacterium]